MAKKVLSLFLCLCMLFSVLSTIAYAKGSVALTGDELDDFLADLNSNGESIKNENSEGITSSDKDVMLSSLSMEKKQ